MLDSLKKIVENTPGALGAILMGYDGITVVQYPEASDPDVEAMSMEISFRVLELRQAANSLELGDLLDMTLKAERGTFVIRCVDEEYFLAVFMTDGRHFGKARWLLRSSLQAIREQL